MQNSYYIDYSDKIDKIRGHPQGTQIYETVDMFCRDDTDAKIIAEYLNRCNFKTFSGNGKWERKEVLKIMRDVKNDRFLYFRILCGC